LAKGSYCIVECSQQELAAIMSKLVLLAGALACAGAMDLTPDNWDSAVAGKTVFIKFQAPW